MHGLQGGLQLEFGVTENRLELIGVARLANRGFGASTTSRMATRKLGLEATP